MSCEHVKELLSAYLDNMLALEEREIVAAHIQTCTNCCVLLEDFRCFDALLRQAPRISPSPILRRRIFSSPEYLELTGTFGGAEWIDDFIVTHSYERNISNRPHLVALAGGRQSSTPTHPVPTYIDPYQIRVKARVAHSLRIMQILTVMCFLLTLGMGVFIGWKLSKQQGQTTHDAAEITPPADFVQGPIPAGTRFVFLRDGALWSAASDDGIDVTRLTPANTVVATSWTVRPALPGRSAGDMVAYIDLQQGRVHIIRSDGQNDTPLQPSLLRNSIQPASIWDTQIGSMLLNSLAWAPDGSMLAFVADPKGTGTPGLYIYSTETGNTQRVMLPIVGGISHPTWSPDSVRLAFETTQNDTTGIFDYNTQNHGILTIAATVTTPDKPSDTVQTLDWSPIVDIPTITWSVGVAGHVHSIWTQRVGLEGTPKPSTLIIGDYILAIYNHNSYEGTGGWVLVNARMGTIGDVMSISLATRLTRFTYGKRASLAQWSPDGAHITYFDTRVDGIGVLHIINTITGSDTLEATDVTTSPSPVWSPDSRRLAYSTGTHILITSVQAFGIAQPLKLQGTAHELSWSATSKDKLIVAMSDEQQGIYLVDTQHNTSLRLDQKDVSGAILWTQTP